MITERASNATGAVAMSTAPVTRRSSPEKIYCADKSTASFEELGVFCSSSTWGLQTIATGADLIEALISDINVGSMRRSQRSQNVP